MFTLTFVDFEIETSISISEFEKMNVLNNIFAFFQLVTRLNSQNRKERVLLMNSDTLIFYMNISISNWHNSSFNSHENEVFYFISVPYTITDLQPL